MNRKLLTIAMLACVLGAVCAYISLNNYLDIFKGGVGVLEESFCAISDTFNCDVVETSSYATINGIPIAGLGLIYYILIFLFTLFTRFSKGFTKPTVAFCWWTSGLAVLYSIFLLYVSIYILNTFCLTCIGMYLANMVLFITLYLAMRMPLSEGLTFLWGYWATTLSRKKKGIDFMPKFGKHLLAFIIIFAIGLVFIASATSNIKKPTSAEIAEYMSRFYRQSKYDIKFNKDNTPMWGTKGAPVTIVEFSDYRCPFCKLAAFSVKPFLTEFRRDIAYYFINYPLDSSCNHYMKNQMHPGACLGAKAAICAERSGKFWDYHDELFRSRGQINMRLVVDLAKRLGIDEKEFTDCINSAEIERKLKDEIEASRRIYITGTPSIFINDRHLKLWRSPDILQSIVREEIERSKSRRKI